MLIAPTTVTLWHGRLAALLACTVMQCSPVRLFPGEQAGSNNTEAITGSPPPSDEASGAPPAPSLDIGSPRGTDTRETGSKCGDGHVDADELCDDGNLNEGDRCTTLCAPPTCSDGLLSGDEEGIDCGGSCYPCAGDLGCEQHSDCLSGHCELSLCVLLPDCSEIHARAPELASRIYAIAPLNTPNAPWSRPYTVFCEMTLLDGGWTLVLVSSDDDVPTWTMNRSALMTTDRTEVGRPSLRAHDLMSLGLHDIRFEDLLFRHQPSGITASYRYVGSGSSSFAAFMSRLPYPACGYAMAGNGFPLSGGSLTAEERLCDTDLYFNLGDHEIDDNENCLDPASAVNNANFGPAWNAASNGPCPFDDPYRAGVGPHSACGECPPGTADIEANGRGFGNPLDVNGEHSGEAKTYLQMYVR